MPLASLRLPFPPEVTDRRSNLARRGAEARLTLCPRRRVSVPEREEAVGLLGAQSGGGSPVAPRGHAKEHSAVSVSALPDRQTKLMDLKASCADLSRYACFVCGCALAARVLAPLRLDEELWWFYVVACGGVLFGPLVGVLQERWHGQATARQLAVARVVYLVLFLQQESS